MATLIEPSSALDVAATLAAASREGSSVRPRGSGTKITWGARAHDGQTYLSTRQLDSPIQHYGGDLVATIPAGATLAEANQVLARERQWLPLDPLHADCATIGGIVATNDSGPRRHFYGSARDLIVGVEFALADGRLAKAGGRVVKNVAGYDLARLLCGSFGSLAVLTSATFKLAPVAPFSVTVEGRPRDLGHAQELALAIGTAPLAPSAIEIEAPSPRVLIRFESTERSAGQQVDAARRILETGGATTSICLHADEAELWRRHELMVLGGAVLFKLALLPTDVSGALTELTQATQPKSLEWAAAGRAALGLLYVRLSGDLNGVVNTISSLRAYASDRKGSLFVLEAPDEVLAKVDAWGEIAHAGVMRAVKARFDPQNVLSPGCGPGGL